MHVSNLYYTEPQAGLAKMLVEWSEMDKVFFCNSGTEANEAAIKIARKFGKETSTDKFEIVTALGSFHGRTMGSVTATGQPNYQKGLSPLLPGIKHAPFNDIGELKAALATRPARCCSNRSRARAASTRQPRSIWRRRGRCATRSARFSSSMRFRRVWVGLGRCSRTSTTASRLTS